MAPGRSSVVRSPLLSLLAPVRASGYSPSDPFPLLLAGALASLSPERPAFTPNE